MSGDSTIRVLHLDDESTVLSTTENYFERFAEDIEIETTTDPDRALERVETGAVDCLLCDYEMPALDGLSVLDRLRKEHPEVPFVMYTGKGSENVASEAISHGADDYVRKDDGLDHYADLTDRIREAVSTHGEPEGVAATVEPEDTAEDSEPLAETRERIEGMVGLDAQRRVRSVDDRAATLLDISPETVRGRPVDEILPEEASLASEIEQATTDGHPVGFSLDGGTLQGAVHPGEGGITIQVTASDSDETGRRSLPAQMSVESVLGAIPDVFYAFDTDGEFHWWNDRLADVTGYTDEEIAGMGPQDFFAEEYAEEIAAQVTSIVEEGETVRIEAPYQHKDGTQIPYEFTGAPIQDTEGEILGIAGIGRNITDRKERQQELEQAETIFENAQDAIFLIDVCEGPAFRVQDVNPAYEKATGLSAETVRGKTPQELMGEEAGGEMEARYRECLDRREPIKYEETLTLEGETTYWDTKLTPIIEDGRVTQLVGATRDVTERREREQELQELTQRLDLALSGTNTGVWEWNIETDAVFWSESTHRLFGMEPGEFEGTFEAFADRVHPEDLDSLTADLETALETDSLFESAFRIVREDGEVAWMSVRGEQHDDDGTKRMIGITTDITERKETELELRESQRKLRQISQNIDDVVWMNTPDQDGIQFITDAYEDIWGRPVDELDENPEAFVEAIHDEDRERVLDAIEAQAEDPDSYDETYRVVQPDGTVRWVRDRSSGVYADGELERIVGIASDVTERKLREEKLQKARDQLDIALEETETGVWLYDIEAGVVTPYGNTTDLFGVAPAETDVTAYLDQIYPEDRDEVEAAIESAIETGGTFDAEFRVADGTRWLKGSGKIVTDDTDTTEMIGITTDITERKAREQQLEASEERFRSVFENAHDALVIANDEGEYVDANPAACDLFGVDYDTLLGQTVADFAPPDFDFEAAWQEFMASDSQRGEFPLVRPSGEKRVVEFSASANIRPGRHLSALRDVTDRREREREIERQKERLELLASTISHDLRNPLRSAQSHLAMAQQDPDADLLAEVAQAHDRIEELIDDLLTLARQGEAVSETERVDIATAAEEAFEQVEAPDATLRTDSKIVPADRTRLLQVFENLFVNAVSHGGEDVTISVEPTRLGFAVADDGSGIPEDEREDIFEYGYTTTETGTGFGLAIVGEIAQAHGWEVTVTDSQQGGARFEFRT